MKRCEACSVDVLGDWQHCPLCQQPVTGSTQRGPFPDVPLAFSRKRVVQILLYSSLALIFASFAVQLFFARGASEVGTLRSVWLGIITMWLLVLTAVRKQHNIAKNTVYLVLLVGLISVYWDYLTGWHGWSLNYTIPIVNAATILGLLITVRVLRMEVGEYIVYSGLTVIFGLVPILFLVFGWATTPLPSAICVAISIIALVMLQVYRGNEVRHELAKRLHL